MKAGAALASEDLSALGNAFRTARAVLDGLSSGIRHVGAPNMSDVSSQPMQPSLAKTPSEAAWRFRLHFHPPESTRTNWIA